MLQLVLLCLKNLTDSGNATGYSLLTCTVNDR